MLFPMVTVLRYSLMDGAITTKDAALVGLQNCRDESSEIPVFWQSVGQTLYFAVMSVIFHLLIGLAFALLLNSQRVRPLIRSILRVLYICALALHGGDHRHHLAAASGSQWRGQQHADDAPYR